MRALALAAIVVGAAASAGCHRQGKVAVAPSVFETTPYRSGAIDPRARVFLVAGGDDIANFAAEVLEQRALWLGAGLQDYELACYYAKPTKRAWADDIEQYREIADALHSCYRADPGRLRADLLAVAATDPSWVYLYVTAHGLASQIRGMLRSSSRRLQRIAGSTSAAERELLDAPAIGLNAGPAPRLGEVTSLLRSLRSGAAPADVLFTPQTLRETLGAFGEDTVKIVVLQACFSGGFIDHHLPGVDAGARPGLSAVPNVVALSATAAERPSFGCGSGSHRTFFGGAFNLALGRALAPQLPAPNVDWRAVYENTAFAVEAMESIQAERPSLPGYFTNRAITPD